MVAQLAGDEEIGAEKDRVFQEVATGPGGDGNATRGTIERAGDQRAAETERRLEAKRNGAS
jgi:hypothetical protein